MRPSNLSIFIKRLSFSFNQVWRSRSESVRRASCAASFVLAAAGNAPAAGSSFNQKTCCKVKQITIVSDASDDLCDYSIEEETFV
jgi:hypothetical protein